MSDAPAGVLYRADPQRGATWQAIFRSEAPELPLRIWPDIGPPAAIRYLVAWEAPAALLRELPALELLVSTGAGVDQLDFEAIPAQLPVMRMVEPGIVDGVVEYATMAVLAAHRDLLTYRQQQSRQHWQPHPLHAAAVRRVGVMGLGVLGTAVLQRLAPFGFTRLGWSRTPKTLDGVETHSGDAQLDAFLARCDVLVLLLPLTPSTRGLLDAARLARLPRGATVVNVGRGALLDSVALLAALDAGHLGSAILDVCDPEPLPATHLFWHHPRVLLTPHVAGMTRPETAARVVIEAIRRYRRGEDPGHLVDRRRHY